MTSSEIEGAGNDVEVVEAVDVPEADLVEQRTSAASDDGGDDDAAPPPTPLEADPADAAEQRRSVPEDDDYPHG